MTRGSLDLTGASGLRTPCFFFSVQALKSSRAAGKEAILPPATLNCLFNTKSASVSFLFPLNDDALFVSPLSLKAQHTGNYSNQMKMDAVEIPSRIRWGSGSNFKSQTDPFSSGAARWRTGKSNLLFY